VRRCYDLGRQKQQKMLHRYTQPARRVIFYARYEASQTAFTFIDSEHLLLGVLHENPKLLFSQKKTIEEFREELFGRIAAPPTGTSNDLPLSESAKNVLYAAAAEADALGHSKIVVAHLVLGLLQQKGKRVSRILVGYRIDRKQILASIPEDSVPEGGERFPGKPPDRRDLHTLLDRVPPDRLIYAKEMLERLMRGPRDQRYRSPSPSIE
jgi:ATP-dependent Clp protease ATP-binding subunit ClpC